MKNNRIKLVVCTDPVWTACDNLVMHRPFLTFPPLGELELRKMKQTKTVFISTV